MMKIKYLIFFGIDTLTPAHAISSMREVSLLYSPQIFLAELLTHAELRDHGKK